MNPPDFPFREGPGLAPPVEYPEVRAAPRVCPVTLPGGRRAVLAVRYADVRTVLSDDRFSRAAYQDGSLFAREPESLALVLSDAPEHTRKRRAVTAAFTARRAEQARPALAELAGRLLRGLRGTGAADLVDAFTVPFGLTVICDILGVPDAGRPLLRPWVDAMMSTYRFPAERVRSAHESMHAYFAGLVDTVWARGDGEGLIAELGRPVEGERRLSRAEAVVMCAGLLMAGYETSSNQLAICVYLLLRDRRHWEHLRATPDAIPAAVEEMLRWTPLVATGGNPHVATEDVELSRCTVRAGEVVVPLVDAANRDPAVFAEPDELDLSRAGGQHVAFGYGRHHCLGAHLARVELQVGLAALLREMPEMVLAEPAAEPPWRTGMFIRGLWHLPVRWTAPATSTTTLTTTGAMT